MKSNEIADILRTVADLVEVYGHKELQHALDHLLDQKRKGPPPRARKLEASLDRNTLSSLRAFVKWADGATMPEIEQKLSTDKQLSSPEALRTLSTMVGLPPSPRQGRDALFNTLLAFLDRTRMHRMISSRNRRVHSDPEDSSLFSSSETTAPSETGTDSRKDLPAEKIDSSPEK